MDRAYSGVWASCAAAIFFSFLMAMQGENLEAGFFIWFVFILSAGLLIEKKEADGPLKIISYSLPPALFFLASAVSLIKINDVIHAGFIISGASGASTENLFNLYFLAAAASIPAIASVSAGRDRVFFVLKATTALDPEALRRFKKNISTILSTLLMIIAFLGSISHREPKGDRIECSLVAVSTMKKLNLPGEYKHRYQDETYSTKIPLDSLMVEKINSTIAAADKRQYNECLDYHSSGNAVSKENYIGSLRANITVGLIKISRASSAEDIKSSLESISRPGSFMKIL